MQILASQFANMILSHRPGYEIESQLDLRESHMIFQSGKDDDRGGDLNFEVGLGSKL